MDIVDLNARRRRSNGFVSPTRVIAVALLCAAEIQAQTVFDSVRTGNGYCHLWQAPPGGSNPSDLSYGLCALDRRPKRLGGPDIPAPGLGLHAGGSIFIAIRPDGSVDSALTRAYTVTGDTSFDHRALEAVRRWRFERPLRGGVPVRAALPLEIASTARDDTLPAYFEWQYVQGQDRDSAIARWVLEPTRPPPLAPIEADSVYASVLRELVRLQVLLPNSESRYCLVASSGDTLVSRRLGLIADVTSFRRRPLMTTSAGCERDPALLRLVMPTVYRTERDRVVLFPRGDFLPVWPWGLDAKSWRAWNGRCVGRLFTDGHAAMACGVIPIISMAERTLDRSVPAPPRDRPWTERDSVQFTVLATRSGAFLVDTLRFTVGRLPILELRTALDSLVPTRSDHPRSGLATAPAAVIRIPELRHETQLGVFDLMRILVHHGPPDVAVLVAYRAGERGPWAGLMARNTGERQWDFGINLDGGRPDAEYWIYLFRRSPTSR
jgi:hypothetical protein